MCSEQLWDKQYQITNQYLYRFFGNLYFVALRVGVSVYLLVHITNCTKPITDLVATIYKYYWRTYSMDTDTLSRNSGIPIQLVLVNASNYR